MQTTDIAQIAAKLSKAQRAALSCPMAIPIAAMGPKGHDTVILGFQHAKSAKALHARGLAMLPWAPQMLTPLGQQVRAYLMSDIRKPTDIATDDNRLSQETPNDA